MSSRIHNLHCLVDLLKVLRSQSMTQAQISEYSGLSHVTTASWINQLVSSGLVVEEAQPNEAMVRRSKFGRAPTAYRLSQAWIGKLSEEQAHG